MKPTFLGALLHIEASKVGGYAWYVHWGPKTIGHNDGIPSLESCLSGALQCLPKEVASVVICFCGRLLGVFPSREMDQCLEIAPDLRMGRFADTHHEGT